MLLIVVCNMVYLGCRGGWYVRVVEIESLFVEVFFIRIKQHFQKEKLM